MSSPKNVKLKIKIVKVDPKAGRVTEWEVETAGGGGLKNPKGDLNFKDKHAFDAPVVIEWALVDGKHDLTFDPDNPVNIVAGEACPEGGGIQVPEFVLKEVRDQKLTVLDQNATEAAYSYTLCFRSPQFPASAFLLDPIIVNGGGGGF